MTAKACPVVIRERSGATEVLAFRHPLAGLQLVKGTIEAGETPEAAALRELAEESGLVGTVRGLIGCANIGDPSVRWDFVRCDVSDAPDTWVHWTQDGGGLEFAYFWHPLKAPTGSDWHPMFIEALEFIKERL